MLCKKRPIWGKRHNKSNIGGIIWDSGPNTIVALNRDYGESYLANNAVTPPIILALFPRLITLDSKKQ